MILATAFFGSLKAEGDERPIAEVYPDHTALVIVAPFLVKKAQANDPEHRAMLRKQVLATVEFLLRDDQIDAQLAHGGFDDTGRKVISEGRQ